MKNRRNYYRILHVQPDAPREVIRSSYRTIMQRMRMHPDLGGDSASAAVVNEAYAALNDQRNRDAYDRAGQHQGWARASSESVQGLPMLPPAAGRRCTFCALPIPGEFEKEGPAGFCGSCDSPLSRVSELSAEESDRRAIARIPKQAPLDFCTRWPQSQPHSGIVEDISLTGMRFLTSTFLAGQQIIKIDTAALKAVGQVVRCQSVGNGWETGVHFVNLCFARARGSFVEERV